MLPPFQTDGSVNLLAQLPEWEMMGNYGSVDDAARIAAIFFRFIDPTDPKTEDFRVQMFAAKCIASDDPRLKQ